MKRNIVLGVLLFCIATVTAYAQTSTLSQTINAGALNITAPEGDTLFSEISVFTSPQNSTGTINNLRIDDNRGNGNGWALSASSQNLTYTSAPLASGNNASPLITLNPSGKYDGSCGITSPMTVYKITISNGGSSGTATYTVTQGCAEESLQTDQITALTSNPIGSKGVSVDFPSGAYIKDDSWLIGVDTFPYTSLTITPLDAEEAIVGSGLTGITKGTSGVFTGTGTISSSRIILEATTGKGMGSYYQDINLGLAIHPNSYAGSYSGNITFSLM